MAAALVNLERSAVVSDTLGVVVDAGGCGLLAETLGWDGSRVLLAADADATSIGFTPLRIRVTVDGATDACERSVIELEATLGCVAAEPLGIAGVA